MNWDTVANPAPVEGLEKTARNINEFVATLAHELRNPLAPIRAAVQNMAKMRSDDPRQADMREIIDRQSSHLARLVEDMIDIARLTCGKPGMEAVPVDIGAVVHLAVEASMPLIQSAAHHVQVDLPAEAIIVGGDFSRLTQVLSNLLNNAAQYTPDGGKIFVTVCAEAGQAVVRVRDTGRGLEAEMMDRVFDMFVQGRKSLQRVDGGLGVGLALARRIAEQHGGTLTGHSEGLNKGAEFVIRIPLLVAAQVSQAIKPIETVGGKPQRILIADDNADAAEALGILLELLGHETRVVRDGFGAIRVAKEFRPDILLLDLGMPGMDGYEVMRHLQQLKPERSFRVIAVTGWGSPADRLRTKESGFDLHLLKPIDMDELTQALEACSAA